MILKKIKISYYSDFLEKTKDKIVKVLNEFGVFSFELVEDFTNNKLDYDVNEYKLDTWEIIFYLPNNRFLQDKINQINKRLSDLLDESELIEIYEAILDTDSYKDEWKKSFITTKITDRITVNPSWLNYEKENEDEIVINIDPSIAFGTGTHETTSLCIDMLQKYSDDKEEILDIGCGSGILMLIARKLGIKYAEGIDIDKNCKEVVETNFKLNNLDNYSVKIGNLVDKIDKTFDIVVSNILVDVLEHLLEDIKKVIKKDTILIFSGILKEKEVRFLEKAKKKNLVLIDRKEKNAWVSLVFKGGIDDNSN
ncbi:50S ribosomal protein L11 methyltransferase [Oceanivirga miroungae]|uniref:Ribosomal protein L11 methyltransferase n=1 Tax=Oceanivirga miroungae TaxID=1130046 RepID=A0A6I8M8L2_9FUSO|nr:50S ribosomal protein L11 methyltransferase [Oceanivirga miroungae]VWL85154.1 50S ribosomal protein L11 methyltransferase [Oceanivirga miroungae]